MTSAWTKFKPHDIQNALWTCSKRFVSVPAGRGSGKTELAKRRLVRFLPVKKDHETPRYFYGGPTQEQARRVAWDSFLKLIPEEWITGVVSNRITTKFGSELYVVGLDKPQRLEGVQWDGCVLDESCDLKPGTFDLNVLPALTWRNGWCWRIGVPKRQGPSAPEYRQWHEKACAGQIEDAAGFTWPSSDILPPDALKYARENMDIKDYNEQFNAVFETAGGQIFYGFIKEYNVRPCAYIPSRAIVVGSDFNVSPMAWVLGHAYPEHIEWFDEIWLTDSNTQATLNVLYERYQRHQGGFQFYGDASSSARKTSAASSDYAQILNDKRFKILGRTIHYPRANPSVVDRFSACNALFCNANGVRRMFVDPHCMRLIRDLEVRAFKPGTRESADHGDVGHITDAMGYPVHKLFPVRYEVEQAPQQIYIGAENA